MNQDTYDNLLALFHAGILTLTSGMELAVDTSQMLQNAIDGALSSRLNLGPLPKGQALEVTNRVDLAHARYVQLSIKGDGPGTMSLPAYQLRLVQEDEVFQRLEKLLEPFAFFLQDQNKDTTFGANSYFRNRSPWGNITANLVRDYRVWLNLYKWEQEEDQILWTFQFYCNLAELDGYLTPEALVEIEKTLTEPLSKRITKKRRK